MQRNYLIVAVIAAGLLVFAFVTASSVGNFGITLMSGLFQGMLLFLVASGLSIIFGLMDVLNLAQGSYFMVGAYVSYSFHHSPEMMTVIPNPDLRFLMAVLVAVGIGALLGGILERGLLRPLYARPIFQIVLTFGVSLVLLEAVKFIWSTTPYSWTELFAFREGFFELFGQRFSTYRLFVIAMGFALIIAIALLLQRTRIGIIIRAGVEDSEMVEALGVNVRAVFTLMFTLGCAVAAFGGAIAAPFLGASTSMANTFLLPAVAVVVLGGLGSYIGTAISSVLLGLAVAVVANFVSSPAINQPVWQSLTPMILLILVLLVRPSGLFGKGS
ncbi:MAG: branched-chain amino acid ABC transporter permease [Chloroflexi bacterium]|nr:branched-chain amino acid ABC transporter permease [Chloroflexota bacterium]